jgi:AraC-like DNA-binding protein
MLHRFPDNDPPGLVDLTYFAPPAHLREHFGPAYLFTADQDRVEDVTRADFPQLRFMLSGAGDYHFLDGTIRPTPELCLLGPTLGATRFRVDGPLQVLGVSVLPLGWMALDLGDAGRIADGLDALDRMIGPETAGLFAKMRITEDPAVAVDALWSFLAARLKPVPDAMQAFVRNCDAWLSGEPSPRVERLAETTGLSSRQTARLTNRIYGAPPKYLARKFRALRCAAEIVLDGQDWIEKVDGTFYDQSHFIREIKHFIGLTPHQLKTEPTIVARLTLQRRAMGASVAEINRIS